MTPTQRPWIRRLVCPGCNARGTLRTILYGMPGDNFDHEKYISAGGCEGQDIFDPDTGCKKCDWSGMRNDIDHFYPDPYSFESEDENTREIPVAPEIKLEPATPVEQVFEYSKGRLDSHTLKLLPDLIQMDSYLSGSIAGGTGTECFHTILGEQIGVFLKAVGVESIDALSKLIPGFKSKDWSRLHRQVHANQSDGFVWSETNWDD
jgi:hypothetical protein